MLTLDELFERYEPLTSSPDSLLERMDDFLLLVEQYRNEVEHRLPEAIDEEEQERMKKQILLDLLGEAVRLVNTEYIHAYEATRYFR